MSVWSFQGGMEIVTECRAEGHFYRQEPPSKEGKSVTKFPQLGAESKLKTGPLTLGPIYSFLDTLKTPLFSFLCVQVSTSWRGPHDDSGGSQS